MALQFLLSRQDTHRSHVHIKVTEGEKTSAVIKSCLMKHNMDVKEAENYNLVQVLSNGSMYMFFHHFYKNAIQIVFINCYS